MMEVLWILVKMITKQMLTRFCMVGTHSHVSWQQTRDVPDHTFDPQ